MRTELLLEIREQNPGWPKQWRPTYTTGQIIKLLVSVKKVKCLKKKSQTIRDN